VFPLQVNLDFGVPATSEAAIWEIPGLSFAASLLCENASKCHGHNPIMRHAVD
jgi:hypothetical protein